MTLDQGPRTATPHGRRRYVLETERLILRAPRLEDAKTIATLAGDRRIAENTARIPHPYRLVDAHIWIASLVHETAGATFLITLRDGTIVGACGFDLRVAAEGVASETPPETLPEIGYWLGVDHWGRGYATEAARAVADHAFMHHDVAAVLAGARTSNPTSRRVLEKCGFQWTGVALHRIRSIDSSAPIDRFRLERTAWSSLQRRDRRSARVRSVA